MADAAQVAKLRRMINDVVEPQSYTDEELASFLDVPNTLNQVAYDIWIEKAASFSTMVDVSESGSSRRMSDLYDNALAQAKFYKGLLDGEEPSAIDVAYPFTVQSERP